MNTDQQSLVNDLLDLDSASLTEWECDFLNNLNTKFAGRMLSQKQLNALNKIAAKYGLDTVAPEPSAPSVPSAQSDLESRVSALEEAVSSLNSKLGQINRELNDLGKGGAPF